jgi:putative lipoprotein
MPKAASIFLAVLFMAGCSSPGAAPPGGGAASARVTGTVNYLQRIALPPTAAIKVQLVDVSRADAPAIVLGEQTIQARGRQVPFAFEISYEPGRIEANHTYAVQARIEDDGRLWFISDTRHAVITRGALTHMDMVLKAVGGQAPK